MHFLLDYVYCWSYTASGVTPSPVKSLPRSHMKTSNTNPTSNTSSVPWGLRSSNFRDDAGIAGQQSQPEEKKHSVDVCRPEPRTLDELEKSVRDTFATVPVHLLRKSVESVCSRLHCVQSAGVCAEIWRQMVMCGLQNGIKICNTTTYRCVCVTVTLFFDIRLYWSDSQLPHVSELTKNS